MFSTFGTLMICVDFRVPFDLIISRNSAQRIGPSFVYGPVDSHWGVHRWAWHWSFNFWKAPNLTTGLALASVSVLLHPFPQLHLQQYLESFSCF